jgi:hypothetical protein
MLNRPFGAAAQPAFQQPPAHQPAAPGPDARIWVVLPGATAPQLMSLSQVGQYPTAAAISEDHSSGWKTVAAFMPVAAAPAAPVAPPQPPPQQYAQAPQPPPQPYAQVSQPPAQPAWGQAPAQPPAFSGFNRQAPAQPPAQPAFAGQAQGGVLPRGMFAGVANAQVTRRGQYMNQGDYICQIAEAQFKPGRTGNMVIIELDILESSYDANDQVKSRCNQPHSRVSVFIKQNDNFASNMKEVMLAVSGFDAQGQPRPETDQVSEAECDAFVSKEQPFAGALVYLEAREIATKAGNPYTRISWWPMCKKPDGSPDTDKFFREVR